MNIYCYINHYLLICEIIPAQLTCQDLRFTLDAHSNMVGTKGRQLRKMLLFQRQSHKSIKLWQLVNQQRTNGKTKVSTENPSAQINKHSKKTVFKKHKIACIVMNKNATYLIQLCQPNKINNCNDKIFLKWHKKVSQQVYPWSPNMWSMVSSLWDIHQGWNSASWFDKCRTYPQVHWLDNVLASLKWNSLAYFLWT